ncbi:MAG: CAAX prenyl protease-related protein [Verrucomicrobia bacterium]|nr:CAAX prenyl protease-related protein [Verrucomicrobiota bacterium]
MPIPSLSSLGRDPLAVRVAPFAVFLVLTSLQGQFGEASRYWLYLVKTLLGAGMLWVVWDRIAECRWSFSWEAVAVGVAVFGLWVGLEGRYPPLDALTAQVGLGRAPDTTTPPPPWNPFLHFGSGSVLAWGFVVVRLLGSTLVVPPLEETFYRSFAYRFIADKRWMDLPLNHWSPMAFAVVSAAFGLVHREWVPGILCGMAYQGLVLWKNRLGDAMTAHAITNLLLGLWVVGRSAWQFW